MALHVSIPINGAMEYIKQTEVSPFISKGVCKVCYVGQQPNRNNTVITKEVATEMGRKLPGSPIVGYFNKETNDFEGHNRELIVEDNKMEFVDTTRPYGFVPTDAHIWFQKFADDGVEHEYLCCDVYIWSKIYPEAERILDSQNPQSMELAEDSGFWTNDDKTNARIFIYNEALIEKLCVLGEQVEPCFEGAQFKAQFSLEDDAEFQKFKATMFSMMTELQETLSKGGSHETMEDEKKIPTPENEFEKQEPEVKEEEKEEEKKPEEKKYNLDEVVEYTELKQRYDDLENKYSTLKETNTSLQVEIDSLKEFKLTAERKEKQAMIDSFYMLSDEDKKDVSENIDNYSLDDIEGKLSIICVRNKVNFNLDTGNEKKDEGPEGLFNLNDTEDNAPEWIKLVRQNAHNCN